MKFTDFNFESSLQESLDAMRFEQPTPIQQQAIPLILEHKDLIAIAQTGTGKTASFLLPVLNQLVKENIQHTYALIIVPTRELALQIDQAVQGFGYFTGTSSLAIYGGGDGMAFEQEKNALQEGANIIIATPGRLMSHMNMGNFRFDNIKFLILDEADKMMDMGFIHDIHKINTHLPSKKQTLLFSATMPLSIRKLSEKLLHNPAQINLAVSKPAAGVTQTAYLAYDNQKIELIKEILKQKEYSSVLVFSSTKQKVKDLYRELNAAKLKAKAIHSDLDQQEREEVLNDFRNKNVQLLVATDILSRGIDIEDIGLVINYDVPGDAEDYIHRIGRTARASSKGEAITFVNDKDQGKFHKIEQLIEKEIEKIPLPERLGAGPLYQPEIKPKSKSFKKPFRRKKS